MKFEMTTLKTENSYANCVPSALHARRNDPQAEGGVGEVESIEIWNDIG